MITTPSAVYILVATGSLLIAGAQAAGASESDIAAVTTIGVCTRTWTPASTTRAPAPAPVPSAKR